MKTTLWAFLFSVGLFPLAVEAQVEGLRAEGGAVFLTHSGTLGLGTDAVESDAGWAVRGRLRYGFGPVSVAGDVQSSSQKYGMPPSPSAPQNLDATFLGVTGALHPFKVLGLAPYAEIGIGKLSFSDPGISTESGSIASSYGVGVVLGGSGRVGFDLEFRLIRLGSVTAQGVPQAFTYDPKLVSLMLSIKL